MEKDKPPLTRRAEVGIAMLWLTFFFLTPSLATQGLPRFEDYKVPVYKGAIHRPEWIRHIGGDEWRDNLGKLVDAPEVNFAGKSLRRGSQLRD